MCLIIYFVIGLLTLIVGGGYHGKSTVLRIMAGLDTEFEGEARPQSGIKVGYLPQEPQLNPDLTVFENVAAECPEKQLLDQFNAISMKLAEDYTDELMEEMTALQEQVDAADANFAHANRCEQLLARTNRTRGPLTLRA